jgi:hypothetical protein
LNLTILILNLGIRQVKRMNEKEKTGRVRIPTLSETNGPK